MVAHHSLRTTKLDDQTSGALARGEVERGLI
jgi:hypothetical protein